MSDPSEPHAHNRKRVVPGWHAAIHEAAAEWDDAHRTDMERVSAALGLLNSLTSGAEPFRKDLGVLAVPEVREMMRALLNEVALSIGYEGRTIEDITNEADATARRILEGVHPAPRQSKVDLEQDAMADSSTPTETELRIQLAEARTDKKFAEMLGEVRTGFAALGARLEAVERSTSGIRTTVITTAIGTGIGVLALVVAIMSYGQTWFGIGVTNRDTIRAVVTEMQAHTPAQPPPGTH